MIDLTLIIEIVTFIVCLWLLYRAFSAPIARSLRQRSERIEEGQRAAEESLRRAEDTQRVVQQQLAAARAEAQDIIASATKAAEAQRQALIAQARGEAEALVQRTQAESQRERQAAVDELRREAGRLAVFVASRLIGHSLDVEARRELVDNAIADIGRRE
jgi:F-type H+-transporting ATPase subunit b